MEWIAAAERWAIPPSRTTSAPMPERRRAIVLMSATAGTSARSTFSSVRREAARAGSAAFLAPEIRRLPERRHGPAIRKASNGRGVYAVGDRRAVAVRGIPAASSRTAESSKAPERSISSLTALA